MFFAPLHVVLGVQLYWASIVFIGYVFLQSAFLLRKKPLPAFWVEAPFFAKILLSFAAAALLFSVWTLLGYLFQLPGWWLAVSYGISLGFSLVFAVVYMRRSALLSARAAIKSLSKIKIFSATAVMIGFLALDYLISLKVGNYLGGDSLVHMSKMRHLAENGFTLTDAYYGTALETRHHLSVVHTLFAVPVFFGIESLNSWFFSLAPIRLFKWASIFYLAWTVLGATSINARWRQSLASAAVIIAIGTSVGYLTNYPNNLATIWVALFAVGLFELVGRKNPLILIGSSALIAVTHSLISLGLFMVLAIFSVGLLVFNRRELTKKMILTLVTSGVLLLSTPIFSALLPNQMSEEAYNYGTNKYSFTKVFNAEIFTPDITKYSISGTGTLYGAIIGIIGFIGFLYLVRDKNKRIVLGSFLLLLPLTLYNPIAFAILHKFLPYWSMVRLLYINAFNYIALFLGILVILLVVVWLWKKAGRFLPAAMLIIACLVVLTFQTFGHDRRGMPGGQNFQKNQLRTYNRLLGVAAFMEGLPSGSVVLANRYYESYYIPAATSMHVIAIGEGNSTPAADMKRRTPCYEKIFKEVNLPLMKQVGVDYVFVRKHTDIYKAVHSDPMHYKLVKSDNHHLLYKVDYGNTQAASEDICDFNE